MYEVVCPDGLVRHTPYADRKDAQTYARFANRAGDGEPVPVGKDCEPNLDLSPPCRIPPPGRSQAHWIRDLETAKPMLDSCPVCEDWPAWPADPTFDLRGPAAGGRMLKVMVDVPCPSCPASIRRHGLHLLLRPEPAADSASRPRDLTLYAQALR